jgi:hypothetical protein
LVKADLVQPNLLTSGLNAWQTPRKQSAKVIKPNANEGDRAMLSHDNTRTTRPFIDIATTSVVDTAATIRRIVYVATATS